MRRKAYKYAAIAILVLSLGSCGEIARPRRGLSGLELTQEVHPTGWGKTSCMTCHPAHTIHQGDPSDPSLFNLDRVREQVEEFGNSTCQGCHGSNR